VLPTRGRREVLPTYKHNRKGKRKPLVFSALREYCFDVYRTICINTLEADDLMGLLATGWKRGLGKTIIVSEDKDMSTIPGLLYNPNRAEEGIRKITKKEADLSHLTQALVGDATDGYVGCPGVGPKTAAKWLKKGKWVEVIAAYEKAGLTEADALVQARVARILRRGEYNHRSKKVNLWKPQNTHRISAKASKKNTNAT